MMNLSKLQPKFSPAEWFVDRRDRECTNAISVLRRVSGGTTTVVKVSDDTGRLTQERLADAQLISVAPEMFLELVRLRGRLEYLVDEKMIADTRSEADFADDVLHVDRLLVKASTLPKVRE